MKHSFGPARSRFFAPEFFLVILIAFGLFSAGGSWLLFGPGSGEAARLFDSDHRWTLLFYQLSVAPIIAYILWQRGWKWEDFRVRASWRGFLQGIGLALVALMLSKAATLVLAPIASASVPAAAAAPAIAGGGLFVAALVKPLFEELLACAYVVQSLRGRFGIAVAVNVSIALRMSLYLYQGPAAFLNFAIFGLLFTLFYVRTGRLWPLIVAHVLIDVIQLAGIAR
jgi:membrane protease YdiL (CAAX protease family)